MIELTKKIIANIESLHVMNKEETFKKYEYMYETAVPEGAQEDEIKIKLACLTYAAMYGREPCEITKDSMCRCFQSLAETVA